MKKYILAIACMLSAMTGFAQDALTVENASITAGKTGKLNVILTNPDTKYIACQFDITLPAGLDVQRTGTGLVSKSKTCTLTERAYDEAEEPFTYTIVEVEGATNQYRFTMYNESNSPFLGTSGEAIMVITVTAAADFKGGEGKIHAITMTNENRVGVNPDDATFTIAETTGISNIENAEQMGGTVYNLAGQKVSKAQKGVFIQNGRKVVIK